MVDPAEYADGTLASSQITPWARLLEKNVPYKYDERGLAMDEKTTINGQPTNSKQRCNLTVQVCEVSENSKGQSTKIP